MQFVWLAFWELHTDRPAGFGEVVDIPFSAIDRYAARYGISDIDEFDGFRALIRAIDREFLKWARRKSAASQNNKR